MTQITVAVNDFVRRQTSGTGKTYADDLTFEQIAEHAQEQYQAGKYRQGYRDGVVLVHVDPSLIHHFHCPFVKIDKNSELRVSVTERREGEEPYLQIRALNGNPLQAGSVDLILYRHDVLAENDEHDTDADWELISFHAVPEGIKNMPMGPVTMMRNQLELPGGTKALYSSEEWADSVRFWQRYAVRSD